MKTLKRGLYELLLWPSSHAEVISFLLKIFFLQAALIQTGSGKNLTPEPLAKLNKTVTPVTSGVQKTLKNLDSGFRRNDVEELLQEAP